MSAQKDPKHGRTPQENKDESGLTGKPLQIEDIDMQEMTSTRGYVPEDPPPPPPKKKVGS